MADLLLYEQWVIAGLDEVGDVGMPQGVHRQLWRQTCRLANALKRTVKVSDAGRVGTFRWPEQRRSICGAEALP